MYIPMIPKQYFKEGNFPTSKFISKVFGAQTELWLGVIWLAKNRILICPLDIVQ